MIERRKTQYEIDQDSNGGCWAFVAGLIFGISIGFLMGWVANGLRI